MEHTIIVATAGQGMLRSNNNGQNWHRLGIGEPIEFDGMCGRSQWIPNVRSVCMQVPIAASASVRTAAVTGVRPKVRFKA